MLLILGESLLDLIMEKDQDKALFSLKAYPGGSPTNVALTTATLGIETSFVTVFGEDLFGQALEREILHLGVDLQYSIKRGETLLAFVSVNEKGESKYFFRMDLDQTDLLSSLKKIPLSKYRLLHFGSLGLLFPQYQKIFLPIIQGAFQEGIPLSFDPNIRSHPGLDQEDYRELILSFLHRVALFKASNEDLLFLLGPDYLPSLKEIRGGLPSFVTEGEKGSRVLLGEEEVLIPREEVLVKDTTGCGDAYMGGVISSLFHEEIWDLPALIRAGKKGTRIAGEVAKFQGAIQGIRQLGGII